MKQKFTFVLIITAFCFLKTNSLKAQVNVQDSLALVDLYNSTNGPGWSNHTNWLTSAPIASWYGLTVIDNRVWGLNLYGNKLIGTIPSSFGKLTNLNVLALEINQLSGNISSSFSKLINLISLELDGNHLTGNISFLGNLTKIGYLSLCGNQFTGNISVLNKLNELGYAALCSNQLSGRLPVLNNLDKINYLDLSYNQFSGNIPKFRKSNVGYFNLDHNFLSGSINHQFDSLKSPYLFIIISNNQLSGHLPAFNAITNLSALDLSFNQFSGAIPAYDSLKNLDYLVLSNNNLTGNIPTSISNLTKLGYLDLKSNHLSHEIPSSLLSLKLHGLVLDSNQFTFSGMENIATTFPFAVYAPQANIHITQNGNLLSINAGSTTANNTYKWYRNGKLYRTKTGNATLTASNDGAYTVEVTNTVATQLTLRSDTVNYVAGINSIATTLNKEIKPAYIFPNPATTTANVYFTATGKYRLTVTDVSGKILQTKTGFATSNQNMLQLNINSFATGLYIITISDEKNNMQTFKLNKQ